MCCAQMTGGSGAVVFGRCDPATWHPDLDWLQGALAGPAPPRMVVLINPCNPTGECRRRRHESAFSATLTNSIVHSLLHTVLPGWPCANDGNVSIAC